MKMTALQNVLINLILLAEFFAAFVALIYFKNVKNTYWKWFAIYLIFIFMAEAFSKWVLDDFIYLRKYYYNFFVIPIEFIFIYWLYGCKSLINRKLFLICIFIYSVSFIPYLFSSYKMQLINSLSYTIGTLIVTVLVLLEFLKQIKSDKILNFKENKMFYINTGIMLFYVGTLPFYAFNKILYENSKNLWSNYGTFALTSDAIMYLLFSAAFIWGKPNI
jgi:hypothetical protein